MPANSLEIKMTRIAIQDMEVYKRPRIRQAIYQPSLAASIQRPSQMISCVDCKSCLLSCSWHIHSADSKLCLSLHTNPGHVRPQHIYWLASHRQCSCNWQLAPVERVQSVEETLSISGQKRQLQKPVPHMTSAQAAEPCHAVHASPRLRCQLGASSV